MMGFEIRGRRKQKKEIKSDRKQDDFPEDTFIAEDDFDEEEKAQEEELDICNLNARPQEKSKCRLLA